MTGIETSQLSFDVPYRKGGFKPYPPSRAKSGDFLGFNGLSLNNTVLPSAKEVQSLLPFQYHK